MQAPSKLHLDAARHILKYVKSTLQYGLFYETGFRYSCMDTLMLIGLVVFLIDDLPVDMCFFRVNLKLFNMLQCRNDKIFGNKLL